MPLTVKPTGPITRINAPVPGSSWTRVLVCVHGPPGVALLQAPIVPYRTCLAAPTGPLPIASTAAVSTARVIILKDARMVSSLCCGVGPPPDHRLRPAGDGES